MKRLDVVGKVILPACTDRTVVCGFKRGERAHKPKAPDKGVGITSTFPTLALGATTPPSRIYNLECLVTPDCKELRLQRENFVADIPASTQSARPRLRSQTAGKSTRNVSLLYPAGNGEASLVTRLSKRYTVGEGW